MPPMLSWLSALACFCWKYTQKSPFNLARPSSFRNLQAIRYKRILAVKRARGLRNPMPLPPRPGFSVLILVIVISALTVPIIAQPVDIHPVRSGPATVSLNGAWQFAYLPGEKPARPDLDATITVPGHWELQGFAEPTYGTKELPAGMGFYRRSFRVPSNWTGQRIFLLFEGVLSGFEARVNGTPIGSWASGYNPVTFDITDQVKRDADNVLEVDVTTRSHGWEFDVNDCWALSGIYRDVTLFAVPATHFTGYTTRTKLNPDGSATLTVNTLASLPATVSGRVLSPKGEIAGSLAFASDKSTVAEAVLQVNNPQLWTAETPALYTLELSLASGQRITEKIGLREVTVSDGVLQLNGRPIKLRGVCHHDIWPDTGRTTDEAKMRRDLELIKAANCNFVRTSHYPPHPRLIELCDELGLYVMDEVPFGFGEHHLKDPAYQEDLYTRARATVRRDRNRPSVIIWSVGNENDNTPLTFATARRVQELDPSRPVCFPQIGSYFAKSYEEIPPEIQLYAPHYPKTPTVLDYATRLTRPVIFTEYAHALGLATDQIQAQWAIIQASPRLAGGAIWMFQDQGILRRAKPGETPATSHELGLNVWPDAEHYYATHGNQGMDGIVYADRTPQTDYWQLRKVYSPVQITAPLLATKPGPNTLALQVENRFDFRSLNGITLTWTLFRNGNKLEGGTLPLQTTARTAETVAIPFTLPENLGADHFTLELHCAENALPFYTRRLRLDTLPAGTTRAAVLAAQQPTAAPILVESAAEFRIEHPGFTLSLDRSTGEITLRDPAGRVLAGGFFPHAGRRFTEGEFMRAKREQTWPDAYLSQAAGLETFATQTSDGVTLRVRGHYARPGAPDQALAGELRLLVRSNGTIEADYDYQPVNGHGMLLEAGLALIVPAVASEFSWIGAGPYAGYPGKDALNEYGRYHLTRADLIFQGNRRAVELALLTDPTGAGVALGGQTMDVAVERAGGDTIFSHNALVSGRGTKFDAPDTMIKAEDTPHIAGKFTVFPLTAGWSPPLTAWFGSPNRKEATQPYFHSYDQ
jgi:beta-galactosidase